MAQLSTVPDFAIILMQPQGLPFTRNENKDAIYVLPSKECQALHIMCTSNDFDTFAKLMDIARTNDLWHPVLGMCYPTIAPQINCDQDILDRYIRVIEIHQSVQTCYAKTVISGLSNVDREFTLCKDNGTTATFTACTLLSHIKVWDRTPEKFVPVFLCLLCHDDHRYHAYFLGGNEHIRDYVDEFMKCPGPQLCFYLLKCHFLLSDVSRFIHTVFNLEQQALCSRAKYSTKNT